MPVARYTIPNGTVTYPKPVYPLLEEMLEEIEKETEREWWMAPMVCDLDEGVSKEDD